MLHLVVAWKLTDVSEVLTAFIIRKAVNTFDTSVNFPDTTRHKIPERSHLHTHHNENLKFHQHSDMIRCMVIYSNELNTMRKVVGGNGRMWAYFAK
jgi:hypothetical protein